VDKLINILNTDGEPNIIEEKEAALTEIRLDMSYRMIGRTTEEFIYLRELELRHDIARLKKRLRDTNKMDEKHVNMLIKQLETPGDGGC